MSEAFDKLPRQTDQQIRSFVKLLLQERVFGDWMINDLDTRLTGMIFLPLALGGLSGFEKGDQIHVWEDLDQAGQQAINGYPIFMSCQVWRRTDILKAAELYEKVMKAQEEILGGAE